MTDSLTPNADAATAKAKMLQDIAELSVWIMQAHEVLAALPDAQVPGSKVYKLLHPHD